MVSEVESSPWCVNFLKSLIWAWEIADATRTFNSKNLKTWSSINNFSLSCVDPIRQAAQSRHNAEQSTETDGGETILSDALHLCNHANANHGGKMNQKFSTSLYQSFDVHHTSDRRGKSGHRA